MLIHYSTNHMNVETFPWQDLEINEVARVTDYSSKRVHIRQGLDRA